MHPKFIEQMQQENFVALTPIQQAVLEPLSRGENILGLAPTGSGKTLAYAWPLLEKLQPKQGTQLLIIAPSQELGAQLNNVLRSWAKLLDLTTMSIIGGANVKRQIEKLKKRPEVIIGTPGRLLNLINDKKLKLHLLKAIVIDEADELLGQAQTLNDCRKLVSFASTDVQLAFFSATKAPILDELTKWFGVTVKEIDVSQQVHLSGEVIHYLIEVPTRKRVDALRKLGNMPDFYGLVFFKQSATLNDVAKRLKYHGVKIATLTSEGRQTTRQQALNALKKREIKLLLTTDLAARGLDIAKLPAVVNYDLPKDTNTYIHRVGRTGRMGADGVIVNLGNEHDLRLFKQLVHNLNYDLRPGYLYQQRIVEDLESVKQEVKPVSKVKVKPKVNDTQTKPESTKKHKKNRKKVQKNKGMRRKKTLE